MEKSKKYKMSDYRYERKFFIDQLSEHEVEDIVKHHDYMFTEIFYKRNINNIYFDSFNMRNLKDNVEGATDRVKVRIRWYGDLFGLIEKPILEIKIKNGIVGKKLSVPLNPFNFSKSINLTDMFREIKFMKEKLQIDFDSLIPSLVNRYERKYFQSSDKKFRITIDSVQSFYNINKENNSFLNSYNDNNSVILELKYDKDNEKYANYITSKFPFRMTKSSKYVSGLQNIYQEIF